ncbi:hypothetical protein DPX16_17625 [Anabarilius grahami]|uniref:Uncharacterized protein n=1 Tax=Anabarilius grahami TaxID=495550 RepID=A0A3N0Y0K1_ANAGA|nr:hypothetical protein DPX16_17625 [Anabarilius grahami]
MHRLSLVDNAIVGIWNPTFTKPLKGFSPEAWVGKSGKKPQRANATPVREECIGSAAGYGVHRGPEGGETGRSPVRLNCSKWTVCLARPILGCIDMFPNGSGHWMVRHKNAQHTETMLTELIKAGLRPSYDEAVKAITLELHYKAHDSNTREPLCSYCLISTNLNEVKPNTASLF